MLKAQIRRGDQQIEVLVRNLSETGAKLMLPVEGIVQKGQRWNFIRDGESHPCQIVRIDQDSVGVEFDYHIDKVDILPSKTRSEHPETNVIPFRRPGLKAKRA